MPHPSCVSLRLSEAESHHSLHMHMHQLIEPPHTPLHQNSSHCELDTLLEADHALQLPHVDSEQRIVTWILNLDACDPDLPMHDQDFDDAYQRGEAAAAGGAAVDDPKAATAGDDVIAEVASCSAESCDHLTSISDVMAPPATSPVALYDIALPIGSTAKTLHVAEKVRHAHASPKRSSPPVSPAVSVNVSDGRPSTPKSHRSNSASASSSNDVTNTHL